MTSRSSTNPFANCSKNQNEVLRCGFSSCWVFGFAKSRGLCQKKIPHWWGNTRTLKCTISKVPTSARGSPPPPLGKPMTSALAWLHSPDFSDLPTTFTCNVPVKSKLQHPPLPGIWLLYLPRVGNLIPMHKGRGIWTPALMFSLRCLTCCVCISSMFTVFSQFLLHLGCGSFAVNLNFGSRTECVSGILNSSWSMYVWNLSTCKHWWHPWLCFYSRTEQFWSPYNIAHHLKTI